VKGVEDVTIFDDKHNDDEMMMNLYE